MHNYTKQDIINSLINIGLKKGDQIFIHSNIAFFGILENAKTPNDYYYTFKSAIFEVIGEAGTMINPTFSYSYCNGEKFYTKETPSTSGVFSELARKDPEAIRSDDPNFSIVAVGRNAEYFTQNNSEYSFGDNSFWKKILDKNGVFVNFNLNVGMATFLHYIENTLNVPYRYHKPFNGIRINKDGKEIKDTFYHFVRDLNKDNHLPDTNKLIEVANNNKIVNKSELGKGKIYSFKSSDLYNLIAYEIKRNPSFLIKGKI